MKRLVVLAVLAALVAVAASTALGRNARPDAPAACAKGAVAARIGGKSRVPARPDGLQGRVQPHLQEARVHVCRGAPAQEHAAKPKPKPPAPTPTPTPAPPYTPPTGTVGTANTTVTVELFDTLSPGSIVLSQTTIPSGMVTFVITNKCLNGPCSFDLQGVKAGAILNPASRKHGRSRSPRASTATTATSITDHEGIVHRHAL